MCYRSDGNKTRLKILDAAGEIFSEKGYHMATNQMIAERCQVNAASISYYFGSKENLYRECWVYLHEQVREDIPLDGNVPPEAPFEVRLKAFIAAMVNLSAGCIDKGGCGYIILREMASPTGIISEYWRHIVKEVRDMNNRFVREFLGEKASEQDIRFYSMCLSSQCRMPIISVVNNEYNALKREETDTLIEYVYEITMAALRSKKATLEKESA